MIEFVSPPASGRTFRRNARVRLSEAGPDGNLRLDGAARLLQDVATDDWEDNGIESDVLWVARRTSMHRTGDHWPQYLDEVELLTWCAGIGAAWAERRTNIYRGGELLIEAASLWVPINTAGTPQRIPASFSEVYGEAMGGRKVSGRVRTSTPPDEARRAPFVIRVADLDIIGHVNNAAIWQSFAQVFRVPVRYAEIVHHGPLEIDHEVEMLWTADELWLLADGEVAVSAHVVF